MFTVLGGVVEFLYQKSMVHCVVCCRQVHKSGSRNLSGGHLLCVESDSTVDLYMTFHGRRYSVQDQSFV